MKTCRNMFRDMMLALGMAILFVYMIMVSLFESYAPSVYHYVPHYRCIGGRLDRSFLNRPDAKYFFYDWSDHLDGTLKCKNAILSDDYTNTLRARGHAMLDAILEAVEKICWPNHNDNRYDGLGMLPLALGTGAGSDIRQSMARIVIGALISSTLLTRSLCRDVHLH